MPQKVYVLSGLGADERVFKYLDFKDWEVVFIKWITPEQNEPVLNYVQRISKQIKEEKPILIGLSFGGIVAIELSKIISVKKLILISSVKTKNDIPFIYRLAGKINIHQLIPYSLLKKDHFLNRWLFGVIRKNDKDLFQKKLADTATDFLKWAIHIIVKWENTTIPDNLYQIHGTNDKLLPLKNDGKVIVIKNGGHLMVLNKAKQLSEALHQIVH